MLLSHVIYSRLIVRLILWHEIWSFWSWYLMLQTFALITCSNRLNSERWALHCGRANSSRLFGFEKSCRDCNYVTRGHGQYVGYMWASVCCFCKFKALILSSLPFFPKQWPCEKDVSHRIAISPLVMTSMADEISIHTSSLDASLISIGKKNETVIHFLNTILNVVNSYIFLWKFSPLL